MNDDDKEKTSRQQSSRTGQTEESAQGQDDFEPTSGSSEGPVDIGAEEFSEKLYDDSAPSPREFSDAHPVSPTGSELK